MNTPPRGKFMFDSTGCTFGRPLLFYIVPRSLLMISVAQRALLWNWICTRELLLLIFVGPRTLLLIYVSSMVLLLIWVGREHCCWLWWLQELTYRHWTLINCCLVFSLLYDGVTNKWLKCGITKDWLRIKIYNQRLSDTSICEHCIDSVEDAHNYFFTCSNYYTVAVA